MRVVTQNTKEKLQGSPPISSIGKRIQHPRPLNVYSSNGPNDCHAWNCSQETIHLENNWNQMNAKLSYQKFKEIKTWCSIENGTGSFNRVTISIHHNDLVW